MPSNNISKLTRSLILSGVVLASGSTLVFAAGDPISRPAECSQEDKDPVTGECPETNLREEQGWSHAGKGHVEDAAYITARELVKAERFDEAIDALNALNRPDDPNVQSYLGFSNRKLGRVQTGLLYYARALDIDPDFVLAREYLGEGHLQNGDIDKARDQLAEIEKRCGHSCEEYEDLAEAIELAENHALGK